MSNDHIKALEKAIDMIEEQRQTIDKIDAAISTLMMRVKKIEIRFEGVPEDLNQVKKSVSDIITINKKMRNELDIVTHDSNALHQVYDHGQDVLDDWKAEMEADIIDTPITRVDLTDRANQYNNRRVEHQMHELPY